MVSREVEDVAILSCRTQASGELPGVRSRVGVVWTHPDRLPGCLSSQVLMAHSSHCRSSQKGFCILHSLPPHTITPVSCKSDTSVTLIWQHRTYTHASLFLGGSGHFRETPGGLEWHFLEGGFRKDNPTENLSAEPLLQEGGGPLQAHVPAVVMRPTNKLGEFTALMFQDC